MRRIDTDDAASTPPTFPAEGTIGHWQDTEPTGGTIVPAWWLDSLDREIENLITGAGLTPSKTNLTQIKDSIDSLIAAAGGGSGGGSGYGTKAGLITRNASGDSDHDITTSIGVALDSQGAKPIRVTSEITKQGDAPWAIGDGNGGMGQGLTLNPNTTYHYFLIAKPSGDSPDYGFDTDLAATNLLAAANADGYTLFRKIASLVTDSSGNIKPYTQKENYFEFKNEPSSPDESDTPTADTVETATLRIPTGEKFRTRISIYGSGAAGKVKVWDADATDRVDAGTSQADFAASIAGNASEINVLSNDSAQIKYMTNDSSIQIEISAKGWFDEFSLNAYNASPSGGSGEEIWQSINANHSAVSGEYLFMAAGGITITLPASPADNEFVAFSLEDVDIDAVSGNPVTIDGGSNNISRNGIEPDDTTVDFDVNFVGRQTFVFKSGKWRIT